MPQKGDPCNVLRVCTRAGNRSPSTLAPPITIE